MNTESNSKRARILTAAVECFTRYGFKRTAMDDIARTAGISRAALYLIFQNKEDIFKTLSEQLYENAINRASSALATEGVFSERLIAAFEGRDLELFELVNNSPHGAELVDINHAIAADIVQVAEKRFETILIEAIQQAQHQGEIDLSQVGIGAGQCATLLIGCTYGLKKCSSNITEYQQQLKHFISIFTKAL